MIKLLLALLITAVAASAGAQAADQFAFLQCGVRLGGNQLTYKPAAESSSKQSKRDSRLNHVAGSVKTASSGFTLSYASPAAMPASVTDTSHSVEFRLPPKVTVASIGCSWR